MIKVFKIITLIIIWSIPLVPLYMVSNKLDIGTTALIAALYLVSLLVSISYKHFWSFQTFKDKKGFIKFIAVVFISFLALLYSINLVYRAHEAYKYLMAENKSGLEGVEYQSDDILGFKPIPNARVFQTFITGDKIPIAYDKNGFRIPLSDISGADESKKTNLLFLGDSYTFGAGCYAEETFPFLVAKKTNLSYINAGVSSYGLAHMLILAEKLIPEYKPDYVIIQYSPWLVSRSINMFAPVSFISLPVPYFAAKNTGYAWQLPAYNSSLKSVDVKQMKSSYQGKFIKFLFKEAFLYSLQELRNSLRTEFLLITGQRPRPATHLREVEQYAYNRIKTIAEKNGATVIILNLGDIEYSKYSHGLFSDANIYFAEADNFMYNFLKTSSSKDYLTEFCHWRFDGKANFIVDYHPNSIAHRLIADSIIKEIDKAKNKSF